MKRPTLDKQPIRVLQAQYEFYTLKTAGRLAIVKVSKVLENLFRIHPDKFKPEDFFRGDITDYQIIRMHEGASSRIIHTELSVLREFWDWMIDFKNIPVSNVALVPKVKGGYVKKQKNRLTLSEFSRLMSEIHDPRVLRVVRSRLLGEEFKRELSPMTVSTRMREACQRAQVPYITIAELPKAVHSAAVALLAPDVPVDLPSPNLDGPHQIPIAA